MCATDTLSSWSPQFGAGSLVLPHEYGCSFPFCVVNLGCKVNKVEADTISASLIALGATPVAEDEASVIVVNTCTVTGEADKKARKAVRHALSMPRCAHVVVTGCAVAIDGTVYSDMDERVHVVQRADLLAGLAEQTRGCALRFGDAFRTRVNIKVQDGCNRACTYCIVHVARGKACSAPAPSVIAEAREYLRKGAKELVLTGIDLGSYRDGVCGIAELVSQIIDAADRLNGEGELPARVRASSLEPVTVDEGLVRLLESSNGRICRHLHLPLQSGSSKVLREMARPYSAEDFERIVSDLRRRVPGISITTDIICGFPGETDDDFEQTVQLARACKFSKIHVFPYSKRTGTPAAERTDQVHPEVKSDRARRLRAVSDELRDADLRSRKGTVELAIVEDGTALTESYHEIEPPRAARPGQLVEITL